MLSRLAMQPAKHPVFTVYFVLCTLHLPMMIPVPHPDRLLQYESLARYTAARLGGAADWLYVAKDSTEELAEVVSTAWRHEIPVRVLGGGANVLVSDKGVRG